MSSSSTGLFIVWRIFQRRTDSLAAKFNLDVKYYYCSWEEKTKLHKAFSYIFKIASTLRDLVRYKPKIVFIQLPPTPVLYVVYTYCKLTNCMLVADCHNAMIYSKWLKWPLAKWLLSRVNTLLVHNEDVEYHARKLGLDATTLRDPLPELNDMIDLDTGSRYPFMQKPYIMVPWSFAPDEPIKELIQAAESMPDICFIMTWFAEKLPAETRELLPPNLVLTGYLDDRDFTTIFSESTAALVLTTREGTQPSGATEAIALGIPLVVSDLNTTRKLYKTIPVYVDNSAVGIQEGITEVLAQHDECATRIRDFKEELGRSLELEIANVKSLLGLKGA